MVTLRNPLFWNYIKQPCNEDRLVLNLELLVSVASDIEATDYFTNHGPRARMFESTMAKLIQCNGVAVSNVFVAAAMVAVEIPDIDWLNVSDMRLLAAKKAHSKRISLLHGSHSDYGFVQVDMRDGLTIENACSVDKPVYVVINGFENLNGLICLVKKVGITIVSHEQGEKIDTFSGATIFSHDEDFLERMRNIRSSYGTNSPVTVPVTSNGRFSEVQAIQGLIGLDKAFPGFTS
jgi:hypothetical protein